MDLHKEHMAGWEGEAEIRQLAEHGRGTVRSAEVPQAVMAKLAQLDRTATAVALVGSR